MTSERDCDEKSVKFDSFSFLCGLKPPLCQEHIAVFASL